MGYHIDLNAVSIMEYKQSLKTGYLSPSRQMIKEDIDRRFELIAGQGIKSAEELYTALKTKKRVEDFAAKSGILHEYLVLLSREIRSLIKKPVKLSEFSMISTETQEKLAEAGVKNTAAIYEIALTAQDRRKLSERSGVSEDEIELIARLADLCRIRWVNHTFAQVLYALGYKRAKDVAQAQPETLHRRVNVYIKENGIYKDSIGLNDINTCVEVAGKLEHEFS